MSSVWERGFKSNIPEPEEPPYSRLEERILERTDELIELGYSEEYAFLRAQDEICPTDAA